MKVVFVLIALAYVGFGKYYKTAGNVTLWDMVPDDEPVIYKACSVIENKNSSTGDLGICYGSNTNWGAYPYMAALRYPSGSACCSGAIIQMQPVGKILTAAHCSVCTGAVIIGCNNPLSCDGTSFSVAQRLSHPQWNGNIGNGFDVAVLTLFTAINVQGAQVMSIPSFEETDVTVRLTGYGQTQTGSIPTQLQTGLTQSLGQGVCNAAMLGIVTITDTMYCVRAGGSQGGSVVTMCSGDSGGPIVFNNQVYGVNSFVIVGSGAACDGCYCCPGYPQVGANVATLSPWINSQM